MFRQLFSKSPELKSPREIALMREAGKVVAEALRLCRDLAKPGVKTIDIDRAVDSLYQRHGAQPLFKGYPGQNQKVPFPASTCISFNEQVVHGIPGSRAIREGDLVKIDTACKLNGWCADAAITIMVGEVRPEWRRLVKVAEEVLEIAHVELGRRTWWTEVAERMQRHAEQAGYRMVTQYVGHGIGRTMHENPQVPNFVNREVRKHNFRIEEGLVLAVEPMVNMGREDTDTLRDHWTVVTRDGLPSVHVEHTFAITKDGVMVLTTDPEPHLPVVDGVEERKQRLEPPAPGGSAGASADPSAAGHADAPVAAECAAPV
jgi:methionyl aminopeptidase